MDVIVVGEGAGVVLRNPKGAIQQDFQYFYRAVTHMKKNGCSVPSLTIYCFRYRRQSRFSSEVVTSIVVDHGLFDIKVKHGGAGRFRRASSIFDSGIISRGGPEV